MFIEINKKRWKKAGAGLLAAALAVGAAGGYRVINPGEAKTISEDTAVNADAQTDWDFLFRSRENRRLPMHRLRSFPNTALITAVILRKK